MDITEIFSRLQTSLKAVASNKEAFDAAQEQSTRASANYEKSLAESNDLRVQLNEALNAQMGEADGRVRIS